MKNPTDKPCLQEATAKGKGASSLDVVATSHLGKRARRLIDSTPVTHRTEPLTLSYMTTCKHLVQEKFNSFKCEEANKPAQEQHKNPKRTGKTNGR